MRLKRLKIPAILFLISLLLNVYGVWWGLPNYYNWSLDDQTPTQPLLIASNGFKINSDYPIFHFVLLDVVYSPYLSYLYLVGGLVNPHRGFPYGFTEPLTSLTVLLVLSRLVSAVMGGLAVVFVYFGVKTLYGKKAALFSALCVAFSHTFIFYSHLGNLDIPYTFWFSIALYSYVNLVKAYKTKYYTLLGIFTALAVATKDQIVGVFMLLPIPLLYFHLKHHLKDNGFKRAILHKKLLYCLLALVLTYVIFSNMLIDFSGFKHRVNLYLGGDIMSNTNPFPNTLLGQAQLFVDSFFKLEYSVGILLSILLIISLVYCIYKFDKYTFALLAPLISYYIFDVAMTRFIRYRMTIPIIIILSFFAGRFLSDMLKEVKAKKFIYSVIAIVFIYTFLYGFSADLIFVYDSRHSAEDWMLANIDKGDKIEVYGDQQFLPRFHALGFQNVYKVFLGYKGTGTPPELIFETVIDKQPSLDTLKARDPDYIVFPLSGFELINYIDLPDEMNYPKKPNFEEVSENKQRVIDYLNLLLAEKTDYKVIKLFNNKIPFAPEAPLISRRANIPVIILGKNSQ